MKAGKYKVEFYLELDDRSSTEGKFDYPKGTGKGADASLKELFGVLYEKVVKSSVVDGVTWCNFYTEIYEVDIQITMP